MYKIFITVVALLLILCLVRGVWHKDREIVLESTSVVQEASENDIDELIELIRLLATDSLGDPNCPECRKRLEFLEGFRSGLAGYVARIGIAK